MARDRGDGVCAVRVRDASERAWVAESVYAAEDEWENQRHGGAHAR